MASLLSLLWVTLTPDVLAISFCTCVERPNSALKRLTACFSGFTSFTTKGPFPTCSVCTNAASCGRPQTAFHFLVSACRILQERKAPTNSETASFSPQDTRQKEQNHRCHHTNKKNSNSMQKVLKELHEEELSWECCDTSTFSASCQDSPLVQQHGGVARRARKENRPLWARCVQHVVSQSASERRGYSKTRSCTVMEAVLLPLAAKRPIAAAARCVPRGTSLSVTRWETQRQLQPRAPQLRSLRD